MIKKEKAIKFAKEKSIREQRQVVLFKQSDDMYWAVPADNIKEGDDFGQEVERFEPEEIEFDVIERQLLEIDDHRQLEAGQTVMVDDDHPEEIEVVSAFQIVTNFGNKFHRTNGQEWRKPDGKQITALIQS
jgi:ADP-ribose pyrophosphatase YjhB (NUDIX family)